MPRQPLLVARWQQRSTWACWLASFHLSDYRDAGGRSAGVSLLFQVCFFGSVPPLEKMVSNVWGTRASVFISAQFKN